MQDDRRMNVYIAAPFFNPAQLATVQHIEHALNGVCAYHSPRSVSTLKDIPESERREHIVRTFVGNIDRLDWCTHMIAVIDDRDIGTIWEMGYAYAKGKKVVSYSGHGYGLNVMLSESVIFHCINIDQVVPALSEQLSFVPRSDSV